MKTRVISYFEIEQNFEDILSDFDQHPLNDESIIDKGSILVFALGFCVSQMKAPDSEPSPEKSVHLAKLEKAKSLISYKMYTCTVEEVLEQVTSAYSAFNLH